MHDKADLVLSWSEEDVTVCLEKHWGTTVPVVSAMGKGFFCFFFSFWSVSVTDVICQGEKFFLGAILAHVLQRETFNLYASLRRRGVHVRRELFGFRLGFA